MHIALVNGVRTPPSTGLSGHCPICERAMIAKCGDIRVHHWAHRGRRICDHWWEPETEWHRNWKNKFEIEWHENIRFADDGEKHIADIRTPHELVIEFQHSAIHAEERAKREAFYGNMVWVVDGTRLKRDFPRFNEERQLFRSTSHPAIFLIKRPEYCFPKQWIGSSVPVFFDFKDEAVDDASIPIREWLWCLLPGRAEEHAVIAVMSRVDFVRAASSGPMVINSTHFVDSLARSLRENKAIEAQRALMRMRSYIAPRGMSRGGRRRRF